MMEDAQMTTPSVKLATLYSIFLPLNHNDGRRMQPERLDRAQMEILAHAPGLTRFSPGLGYWIDRTAKVYRDFIMPIQTATTPTPETLTRLIHWAARMAVLLEQEQIFLLAQSVSILEPTATQLAVPIATRAQLLQSVAESSA